MNKKYFFYLIFLSNFLVAKEYNIGILTDLESQKYINKIEEETKKLFFIDDKIDFKITLCKEFCVDKIKTKEFVLLKSKELKQSSNSLVTYNEISSEFDENRVIRASALTIFEYLKENKRGKYLHFENEILQKNEGEKKSENSIDINDIYSLALKNNLQILQNLTTLKTTSLDVDEALSDYKPQIDFYSNLIQIDGDKAKYSSGLYSQGVVESGVKLRQIIYSNQVIKNIKIKELLEKSNKNGVKAKNDEVFYTSVITYLNLIKAKNYNEIIKIKQNFIKENLNFAKQRVEVGVKDKSDIFRWESELANANMELETSKKELESLKIELAYLLQINRDFSFLDYSIESKIFKLLNQNPIEFISNKRVQELFLDEIIYSHSTLKQLHDLIIAKNEEYKMNKSSNYLPTLSFEGDAKRILNRYGDGANTPRYWDDEEYQAVINLTLPIFEGGLNSIKVEKNEVELLNLKLQYNEIKNLIIKNIEQNYDSLEKSFEKISYSKRALEFAKKNFELIQEKYRVGNENIISLLDAQNTYIISKLNENISITDYLIDLSSIYYFSGNIDILVESNKKESLEKKILEIMKENR